MMRSLYSGVAGLKTHQIRMDVIGNNIANVNTTAYKSSSMTFSELMSQTTQKASGANAGRLQEITTRNTIHTMLPPSFCSVQTQPGKQALPEGLCVFLSPI